MVAVARRRVADDDAEDVVQATLAEALTSREKPQDPEALRRWLWGVLRHKIADHYRKRRREVLDDDAGESMGEVPDDATEDLLRWAVARLPKGGDVQETFQWLLREGEGEKLENIAEEMGIPAPRVRKRVSRLREHLRSHWGKEVAILAAFGIVGALVWFFLKKPLAADDAQVAFPDPAVQEQERKQLRGIDFRRSGLRDCEAGRFDDCSLQLDEAKKLDPAGEADPRVQNARKAIEGHVKELLLRNQTTPTRKIDAPPVVPQDSLSNPPLPAPTAVTPFTPPLSTAQFGPAPKKAEPPQKAKKPGPSEPGDLMPAPNQSSL